MSKEVMLTAEEMIRRYQKECRSLRRLRWVTLAAYVVFLFLTASNMNLSRAAVSVIVFVMAMRMLQSMETQQFTMLQQVLNQSCDAVKYTTVMEKLLEKPGKEEASFRLCYAKGLYYSGRFAEAREALQSFYMERPSVGTALLYHMVACGCFLELEDADGVRKERDEAAALLRAAKPKQQAMVQQQIRTMDGMLALVEERYDDFFRLQSEVLQQAESPLQRMAAAYRLALAKIVIGEDAEARQLLEQVVENGGTCFMAAEAANLLEEFALPEKSADDKA